MEYIQEINFIEKLNFKCVFNNKINIYIYSIYNYGTTKKKSLQSM